MDVLQVVSAATQIVSSMVAAIGALDQASRNLDEAPKRVRSLEEFVYELENLARRSRQKHAHKLHSPHLDRQIQSLNVLVERLHPNIMKARRVVSKSKSKNAAKVFWHSIAGDPLGKTLNLIRDDLNWWLESQSFTENVEKMIETTARSVPIRLKINTDQGYPIFSKCSLVRSLLAKEESHRVVLIVGFSGIGKSCLARQVASDLPSKFVDGAVELGFGQWCSKAACNGDKAEYQKRLARKLCKFLVQIGYKEKIGNENSGDVEYICCLLQEALFGKCILILHDDVWEQDIVERFAKLYDNDCRYLVTTRNESVHEITEAEKIELSKDDVKEISKAILLYHSLLKEDELPVEAEMLLDHCGHHPLTVAVMGKALRKETRAEKWEKAISNLSTYATCAPGPISYANEKAENTVTIFRSFEFSLEVMPADSRRLFISLASLSWAEPIPEACLEAIWSVIGQESLFSLTVCKLAEGSLLMKIDSDSLYQVHDMVSLYFDGKTDNSDKMLLVNSTAEGIALISPWLCIFGKETVKRVAEQKVEFFLSLQDEKQAIITLRAIVHSLMASTSVSDLEASRAGFSKILGPKIADLISGGSLNLIEVSSMVITNIFSRGDYSEYLPSLETISTVDKLARILDKCEDPMIQTSVLTIQAKLAEVGMGETVDEVLQRVPMNQVAHLLSPDAEKWHDSMFTILTSLIKAGKSKAVERMFAFEIDKSLFKLLESGTDIAQHHAILILKALYELGGPSANGSLRPNTLNLLPWQARIRLEKFVLPEQHSLPSPKPQSYEDIVHKVIDSDDKQVLGAMQDLIPITEKAGEPRTGAMILHSPLIKRLSELLQNSRSDSLKSASAFILMKLACSGGEPFIKKFLEHDIIPELIKMMQFNVAEVQDSAYAAVHQMLYAKGGVHVLNQMFKMGLLERLLHSLESRSAKTREVSLHCILDIVEVGNKTCLERMFSLQVIEKLVKNEQGAGGSGEFIIGFLKGISKCKNLTTAERWVMKQQTVKKARNALRGHRLETTIMAAIDAVRSEGSSGGSSGSSTRRRR